MLEAEEDETIDLTSLEQAAPAGEADDRVQARAATRATAKPPNRTSPHADDVIVEMEDPVGREHDALGRRCALRRRRPSARIHRRARPRPAPAPDLAARDQPARSAPALDRRSHRRRAERRRLPDRVAGGNRAQPQRTTCRCRSPTSRRCSRSCRRSTRPASAHATLPNASRCSSRSSTPRHPGRDLAIAIARDHLQAVADKNLADVAAHCSAPTKNRCRWRSRSCAAVIRGRARRSRARNPEYIVPDVFVRRTDQGWSVELNSGSVPRLRVNQSYAGRRRALGRLRVAARAAAGGALADPQPRDPQRDAAEGCALDRAAPGRVPRARRRSHAADDPARRGRGRQHARIDDLARDDRQVHAHAARHLRVPLFLLEPRVRHRRRGRLLGGHPGPHPQADRATKHRTSRSATPSSPTSWPAKG